MSKARMRRANAKGTMKLAVAAIASTVIALPTVGVAVASADDGQTGSGETSLVVHLAQTGEYGGTSATGSAANPDEDGDGLGDNLAFTAPIQIDFAAAADGTLVGPSASAVYIENESRYGIRVSALDVDAQSGWSIVGNASGSSAANAVDLEIGPANDMLSAASYLEKAAVATPAEWNMAAKTATGVADRVELSTDGHINNVEADLSNGATFGQIRWYVTPGASS